MSRLRVVLLAVMAGAVGAAVAGVAGANGAAAQTQSTSPTTNAGTKLAFPATLGGAQFERVVNYAGPPANRPDQGATYFYSTPKKMVISVHVYDGGRRVPPGSGNPLVVDEFMGELTTSEQQVRAGGYTRFERPSVPSVPGTSGSAHRNPPSFAKRLPVAAHFRARASARTCG